MFLRGVSRKAVAAGWWQHLVVVAEVVEGLCVCVRVGAADLVCVDVWVSDLDLREGNAWVGKRQCARTHRESPVDDG